MFPAYFYFCKYISFFCNFCVTVCYKLQKTAKITAIKAEAGASGSTGNVQTDVYLSMDGGNSWTQIGSIKQNSTKSAYTPLDYSEEIEIDASTSALIQFRPYWTAARSSASFTSLSDFTVTVQYE